nr:hypothetical protein Iba_chr04cCG0060 [Ipomoea batatas]
MSHKHTSLASKESVRKNPKVARVEYNVSRHEHMSVTIEYDEDEEEEEVRRGSTNHGSHGKGNHAHANSKKSNSHGGHSKHDDDDEYSEPYGKATVTHVAPDY